MDLKIELRKRTSCLQEYIILSLIWYLGKKKLAQFNLVVNLPNRQSAKFNPPPNLILCQICRPYCVIMHANNSVVIFIFIKYLTFIPILPRLYNSHNGSCRVVIFSKVFDLHIYPSHSLVPRPPPFFVLQFAFSIIYRNGRAVKCREALGTPITWMTSGGHKVDVRGGGVHVQITY